MRAILWKIKFWKSIEVIYSHGVKLVTYNRPSVVRQFNAYGMLIHWDFRRSNDNPSIALAWLVPTWCRRVSSGGDYFSCVATSSGRHVIACTWQADTTSGNVQHYTWCFSTIDLYATVKLGNNGTRLLLTWITLIPAWISNYIHYKVCDEITYPFPNFSGGAVEVWDA